MPTASFQAKLVIRLAESMLLTCLQRQGVLQFSKAQHFFPCGAAEFTKKEHLQNLLLIVHCCTDVVQVCFLLKMHSNLHFCFCRRGKYSFFLDALSSKLNALRNSGAAFMVDNTFNMRSHLQNSHSFSTICLNPQSLTDYFHFPF